MLTQMVKHLPSIEPCPMPSKGSWGGWQTDRQMVIPRVEKGKTVVLVGPAGGGEMEQKTCRGR